MSTSAPPQRPTHGAAGGQTAAAADAASGRPTQVLTAVLALAPGLLFVAAVAQFVLLRQLGYLVGRFGFVLGHGPYVKAYFAAFGLLALFGFAAALVIAFKAARPLRATSLRTRSFFVIAVAVLMPSLCLSALSVNTYFRTVGVIPPHVNAYFIAFGLLELSGVVAALVIATRETWPLRAASLRTRSLFVIAVAVLIPSLCLSCLSVLDVYECFIWDFRPLGDGPYVKAHLVATGLLALYGVVAALVIAFTAAWPVRATSLRTRSFIVIAVVVLIPALCLSAFGVWAYYRSWETAGVLYTDQAAYNARELGTEIASISDIKYEGMSYNGSLNGPLGRGNLTLSQRNALTRAIVLAYAGGHRAGAWWGNLGTVWTDGVLPSWAVWRLGTLGFAIGTRQAPSAPGRARIVAWRVGRHDIRYYTDYATGGPSGSFSPQPPVGRLAVIGAYGIALVALIGALGAWVLSRSVVRPVRRLAEASGRLAEGEAGVSVTPEGPRELRELAASFNDMNAKLTKAQEAEQSFLLSVSHELKTPLTSVRGYAEGIADGTVKPAAGATVIGAESSRLERLVGDLLDSARMRKSAFAVRREAVDLAALAQDVARRYEGTAREAGLALNLMTEAGGAAIADNDRVLQVVSNLVENAIRCTPAPGTVTVSTGAGWVSVADTGRGLTGDDLLRAFERFYLYSRYGTDRPVGTGLGLAIVKELTEAMGGSVTVSSAVGVGTAFVVTLPTAGPTAPADVSAASAVTGELPHES